MASWAAFPRFISAMDADRHERAHNELVYTLAFLRRDIRDVKNQITNHLGKLPEAVAHLQGQLAIIRALVLGVFVGVFVQLISKLF